MLTTKPLVRNAAAVIGMALIAYAILAFNDATPFPGVAALAPCMGAALVIGIRGRHG